MTFGFKLLARWRGERVGADDYGNVYFQARRGRKGERRRRWVIYDGEAEASKVPPEWHAWLHYTIDLPPADGGKLKYDWQLPHQPNMTGTAAAYRPPGHTLAGGTRDRATGDYEPWTPGQD